MSSGNRGYDTLLDRIADTLADLVPYDALQIYEADNTRRELIPVLAQVGVGERDHADTSRVRAGHAQAGHRQPRAGACEPGSPRLARRIHPRDARRARGARLDSAHRARVAEGRAQHLPARGRQRPSTTTSSSSRSGSEMRPRSRSTTLRSAPGSSTRHRPTRLRASTTTATSTSGCVPSSCGRAAPATRWHC